MIERRVAGAIFAGGSLGALARAGLLELVPVQAGSWPWATFAANLAGALLLGAFAASSGPTELRAFREAGICGALTTFSTLQLEVLELGGSNLPLAIAYLAASIALGLVAVRAGRLWRLR